MVSSYSDINQALFSSQRFDTSMRRKKESRKGGKQNLFKPRGGSVSKTPVRWTVEGWVWQRSSPPLQRISGHATPAHLLHEGAMAPGGAQLHRRNAGLVDIVLPFEKHGRVSFIVHASQRICGGGLPDRTEPRPSAGLLHDDLVVQTGLGLPWRMSVIGDLWIGLEHSWGSLGHPAVNVFSQSLFGEAVRFSTEEKVTLSASRRF